VRRCPSLPPQDMLAYSPVADLLAVAKCSIRSRSSLRLSLRKKQVMERLHTACSQLLQHLQRLGLPSAYTLGPGLQQEDLRTLASMAPSPLPDEVLAFYQVNFADPSGAITQAAEGLAVATIQARLGRVRISRNFTRFVMLRHTHGILWIRSKACLVWRHIQINQPITSVIGEKFFLTRDSYSVSDNVFLVSRIFPP